jgi:hypothetical protein
MYWPTISNAQERRNPDTGLFELTSPRMTLITDIPLDDELRSWPIVLEQSLEQWQKYYGVTPDTMANFQAKVYLIGDQQRFEAAKLMGGVPGFEDGYQYADRLYLREQPSVYYRRHLFIHEANHWIMLRLYGGAGSAWFMEGMADMQATHVMRDGKILLNTIPASPLQVPFWGRLKLLDQSLKSERAPSLGEIIAFPDMQQDRMDRYAWSWAACVFFSNHPKYGPILLQEYRKGLDYSGALSKRFKSRLEPVWDQVQTDWCGFVSDLDFGYDMERSIVVSENTLERQASASGATFQLSTSHGWQSTGLEIQADQTVSVQCDGSYVLQREVPGVAAERRAEPQGITADYFRGKPLGCVLAAIVPRSGSGTTKRWEEVKIGKGLTFEPGSQGVLFLKVNEPSSGLHDNQGSISVVISVTNRD